MTPRNTKTPQSPARKRRRRQNPGQAAPRSAPQHPVRSRWHPGYVLRHPTSSVVVAVLAVVLFATMSIWSLLNLTAIRDRGVIKQAEVYEVVHGGKYSTYTVLFKTYGRLVITDVTVTSRAALPGVGEQLEVIYDPQDPYNRTYWVGKMPSYVDVVFGALLSLVMAVLAWWLLIRHWTLWRDNAEAWRTGDHFG